MRVGIIGMGFGAQVHFPALLSQKDIEITAIADSGSGRARQVANSYGLDIPVFDDGAQLVKSNDIDLVTIATPAQFQCSLISDAIKHGKHVICEKPFGTRNSLSEIDDIKNIATKKNIIVVPAYSFRFDSGINLLINLIHDGIIGEVISIDISWLTSGGLDKKKLWTWRNDISSCGGVLIDWCGHVIDYCSLISESDVKKLQAITSISIKSRDDANGVARDVTAPDSCELELIYKNGIKAQFQISNVSKEASGHSIKIKGSAGSIIFHHASPFTNKTYSLIVRKNNKDIIHKVIDQDEPVFNDQRILAFSKLVTIFVDKVKNNNINDFLPNINSARKIWSVLSAAEYSARSGSVVDVSYL